MRVRGFTDGLRRFAAPSRRSIPLVAVEGLGRRPIFRSRLGRFARLDVCLGLRRTRADAGPGVAPVAQAGLSRTVLRGAASSTLRHPHFLLPCVFGVLLRVNALVLQPASRGVAVGCLVWFWR